MQSEQTPDQQSEATPGATSGAAAATAPAGASAPVATENLILNNFPAVLKDKLKTALTEYNVGKAVQLTLAQFIALRMSEDVELRAENDRLRTSLDQCETQFKTLGNAPEEIQKLQTDIHLYKVLEAKQAKEIEDLRFKLDNAAEAPNKFDALTDAVTHGLNRLLDRFEECAGPISYDRDDLAAEFWVIARDHFKTALPA